MHEPEEGRYEFWSTVNIAPAGKPRHEPYFASLIVQKSYVGLYFMPLYADQGASFEIGGDLETTLKGKSCFHLKKLTPVLREQIADALERGFALYQSKGWV